MCTQAYCKIWESVLKSPRKKIKKSLESTRGINWGITRAKLCASWTRVVISKCPTTGDQYQHGHYKHHQVRIKKQVFQVLWDVTIQELSEGEQKCRKSSNESELVRHLTRVSIARTIGVVHRDYNVHDKEDGHFYFPVANHPTDFDHKEHLRYSLTSVQVSFLVFRQMYMPRGSYEVSDANKRYFCVFTWNSSRVWTFRIPIS